MPGLVVAVSERPEARARATRAAQPLLRRPWEELAFASPGDGPAALGFAGERGSVASDEASGCLAALDGELYASDRTETEAGAARLLSAYLEAGAELVPPEGSYAGAIWNPRQDELVLVTDRYGSRPLYVTREGADVLAAGELKGLVAGGVAARLDFQTWAELFAYEHALPGHAPLAGVRRLPPGTVLTARGGKEEERTWWRYRLEPAAAGDDRELVEEFGRLLDQAIARRLDPGAALTVSGGLDSRCVALALSRSDADLLAATYGAVGSDDLRLGSEVAALLELRHRALPLSPGYIAQGALEVVWLTEGFIRCFHAHHLALRPLREEEGVRVLLIGFSGDDVVRASHPPSAPLGEAAFAAAVHARRARCLTDERLEELAQPGFAAELRGRASRALADTLAADEGSRDARFAQLLFRNWQSPTLVDDHFAPRDPFSDHALVDFCRTLPPAAREGGRLELAFLRSSRELAELPSTKDGVPPARTGLRRQLGATSARVRKSARARVDNALGPGWWPNRRGLGSYGADLRGAGQELLGLLLEPRTLERGRWREQGLRRLVNETLTGKAEHTQLLGMLLTLELFERQLVDGDGFGAGVQASDEVLTA